jgi:DNA-binding SARP family transcriptional activator
MVSRPAQSLFAYVILNAGTVYRREKLAGLFWPDSNETNARSNLRHVLWRIRKCIGDTCLQTDKLTVTFASDSAYWLDTKVLTDGVTQGTSVAALEKPVSAYQGELLPGFYDEWVLLERERLRAVYDHRMQQLCT